MALKAFRGTPFEHTHENRAFNELFDLLDEHCSVSGQDWYLLGNFYVGSRELDAMVIKPNAVIILDFKEFRGKLQFSDDGPWLIEDEETGSNVQVKGGASVNPLRQLRINKGVMLDFLGRNFTDLNATCNWRHVAALVAFQGPIEFDHRHLPGPIKPWFHISDMGQIVRDLDAIVSREIFLSRESMERLTAQLGIDPFVPAGAPKLNRLCGRETSARDGHRLTQQQSQALGEFSTWLKSGSGVFRLAGMVSTGKRFLFPHLVDALEETAVEMLLLTPSARTSSTYHHPMAQPISIYTWLYSQQPNRFETKDGRKLGIHEIREDHPLHGKIPVLVDAHLLSDEEFEVGDRRYGSGRLIHDFLSVIAKHKTPFVVIGDPYQMPRGSLQRSLISGNMLEQLGLGVVSYLLTEQILDDGDDALSKLQAHLVDKGATIYIHRDLMFSAKKSVFEYRKIPKPGTFVKIFCDMGSENQDVISVENIQVIETQDIRSFKGRLKVSEKGFGFVSGEIFAPATLVEGVQRDAQVAGVAVMSFDKTKNKYGWKAISLLKEAGSPNSGELGPLQCQP